MRQTLFRIRADRLWSLQPIDLPDGTSVAAVGGGVLLLAWLIYGVVVAFRERQRPNFIKRLTGPAVIWMAVLLALVSLPAWAPKFLPHGIPVFGYGTMVFLGFAGGAWTAFRRARLVGVPQEMLWDLLTWFFIAGIGGARLFYLVQFHQQVFESVTGPGDALLRVVNLADGGLVLLGGVLLVCLATYLFCRARSVPVLLMADLLVPSFFVGLAFGRLGCFLNGCCFGDRCAAGWAVHFPAGSVPWKTLLFRGYLGPAATETYGLHPTQLYSALAAAGLAWLTAAYFPRRQFNGAVLVLGMLLYPLKRVVLEFLRDDELGQWGTGFTISQFMSAGIFLGGLVLLAVLTLRQRWATPADGNATALATGNVGRNVTHRTTT